MEKHVTELVVGKWYEATTEQYKIIYLWNSEDPYKADLEIEYRINTPCTFLVLRNAIEVNYRKQIYFSFKILVNGLVKNVFLGKDIKGHYFNERNKS